MSSRRRVAEAEEYSEAAGPGVYLLYGDLNGPPRYVGRSVVGHIKRMLQSARAHDCACYSCQACDNMDDAIEWECRLFHQHFLTLKHNLVHPTRRGAHAVLSLPAPDSFGRLRECCAFMLDPELPDGVHVPPLNFRWQEIKPFAKLFQHYVRIVGLLDNDVIAVLVRRQFDATGTLPALVTHLGACLYHEWWRIFFDENNDPTEADVRYLHALIAAIRSKYS